MSRSRAGSSYSVHTIYNINNPGRQASTTSLSSSIYSDAPTPNLSNYQFHPSFDQSLMDFYLNYVAQPNITPFDHNFPPSGVLSKISKLFWSQYDGMIDCRVHINDELVNSTSIILTVIRMRLLNLIQRDLELKSIPFTRSHSFKRTDSLMSVDSNIDMVNIPQFLPSQLGNFGTNGSSASNPMFSLLSQPNTISTPPAVPSPQPPTTNQQQFVPLLPPLPTLELNKRKPNLSLNQPPNLQRDYFNLKSPQLYSPYEQGLPSPLYPDHESTQLKTTIMRKRDSLNLKRNGL